jgi:hypothetical protein
MWGLIDWDVAAPGTRLWDLAYAAHLNRPGVSGELSASVLRVELGGVLTVVRCFEFDRWKVGRRAV